jgi:phosphoribosylamine--glycine ligase
MLTDQGPKLVEYNARFGDPETQVMMMRMESDLLPLLHATATGTLGGHDVIWKDAYALTIIMATKGYPGDYGKGSEISGADGLDTDDLTVFHAGTKRDGGRLLANGGRVLNVTALGNSVREAQDRAYRGVDAVDWPEGFSRRDIGWREIARERT